MDPLGVDGSVILRWILERLSVMVCVGLRWLRVGCSGSLL
jgi:hypothetical protein